MSLANEKFIDLGRPRRIWAVAAIHGDRERLMTLHDHLASRFAIQDRLVYLGNYLGKGSFDNQAVIEELLAFRAALLAKPGMEASDIVHLRGPAEEAWQRLLRLQFAPRPIQALERYLEGGAESYLRLYGVSLNETKSMARAGSVVITRWTNQLRVLQRQTPGHEALVCSLRRAAITSPDSDNRAAFVPAGFNSAFSLEEQGDHLWFAGGHFGAPKENISIARVIRGFDPLNNGVNTEKANVTLDAGCGKGGPLVCGCFSQDGRLLEIVAVGGKGAVESSRFDERVRPATGSTTARTPLQPQAIWDKQATA